jgi:sulfide:quinone oxidoreductase
MFGRRSASELWHPYRNIDKLGVTFRQETVLSINAAARVVATDGGNYKPDILVVALGADYDISATPGLAEDGYEFYSVAGVERARDALDAFSGGAVIIGVLGGFFKCPGPLSPTWPSITWLASSTVCSRPTGGRAPTTCSVSPR